MTKKLLMSLLLPSVSPPKQKRIYLLDEIRGTAVIAMLLFHLFFSAGEVFHFKPALILFNKISPAEPAIAVTFIVISGICARLSRSNLKRGLILFTIAVLINIITEVFVPEFAIKFGVINLLSVCMIIYGLFEKPLLKIKPQKGLCFFLVMFMLTWSVEDKYIGIFDKLTLFHIPDELYRFNFLFPLGFKNSHFRSGDYFPIIPWIFLFFSGAFFARLFNKKKLSRFFYIKHS